VKRSSVQALALAGALTGMTAVERGAVAGSDWQAVDQPELKQLLDEAPALTVEDVCVPVTTTRRGALMWVPNPDGKTYDLLQWYFRGYSGPTTVFIMDLATGELTRDGMPDRRQVHICGRALAPDGRLWLATPDWKVGMNLFVYDPATNKLEDLGIKVPHLSGEKRDLTVAPDGKIYGTGSYMKERKAGAYQIDPASGEVTIYGPVGPSHAPNGVWGYSIAADERWIYVASGKIPWYLVAYDRETGSEEVLVTTENVGGHVGVRQHRYGCSAVARKVAGTDGARTEYWLHQGKAIPKRDAKAPPPWPAAAEGKPWVHLPPKPEVSAARSVPDASGVAEIWHRTAEAKAAAPATPPPGAKPEDLGWRAFRLEVPVYPTDTHRVVEMPDGRIFGTAGAYEGNFVYDPKTGRSVHLGKIPLSHYATAMHEGRIYMSGYPTSPLYVYDPGKPWTAGSGSVLTGGLKDTDERSNPRLLVRLGEKKYAGTHKMYAAAVGADGRIYFGGRWVRDGAAGGLGWWDPAKQEAGGMWEIFSNCQINYITTACKRRFLVISTHRVDDPLLGKPKPEQGRLFVFDATRGEVAREIDPVAKAKGAGLVAGVGGSRVLGWTENPEDETASILYGVDVETGDIAFRKSLPHRLPVRIGGNQKEQFDYRLGPDGKVWTYLGAVLVRIDPATAAIEPVGKASRGGRIAFSGADIYLAGATHLRRITGVVGKASGKSGAGESGK